jgi:phosphate starvation-inducible protein PhoH and related proteins
MKRKETANVINHKPTIHYSPKTQGQAELYHDLDNVNLMVALGPAGTGKTYTCCVKAASWLVRGAIHHIILTRANVSTGKSLGAVPGTLEEKLEPWMMPMTDVLREALGKGFYEYNVKRGRIETVAIETIRGRSFQNAMILVDEAQQLTIDELKAITTRIGEGSVLVLMGDPKQSDLQNRSGLMSFVDMLDRHDPVGCGVIEFDLDDIVRSDTCAQMVRMFYKENI